MIEFLFLIAEFVGQTANRALRTNAVDHVTDLKIEDADTGKCVIPARKIRVILTPS